MSAKPMILFGVLLMVLTASAVIQARPPEPVIRPWHAPTIQTETPEPTEADGWWNALPSPFASPLPTASPKPRMTGTLTLTRTRTSIPTKDSTAHEPTIRSDRPTIAATRAH